MLEAVIRENLSILGVRECLLEFHEISLNFDQDLLELNSGGWQVCVYHKF